MTVYRISHAPRFAVSATSRIIRRGKDGWLSDAPQSVYGDALPLDEVIRLMEWAYDAGVRDAKNAMRAAIGFGAFDDAGEDGR